MSKDAIPPPVHEYIPGVRGNCANRILPGGRMCNRQPESPVHRYYPCSKCNYNKARSIEARDRHEADTHGDGW